jgi:hypothetical protein
MNHDASFPDVLVYFNASSSSSMALALTQAKTGLGMMSESLVTSPRVLAVEVAVSEEPRRL